MHIMQHRKKSHRKGAVKKSSKKATAKNPNKTANKTSRRPSLRRSCRFKKSYLAVFGGGKESTGMLLIEAVQSKYNEIMRKTASQNKEFAGVITDNFEFKKERTGTGIMVSPHCEAGYTADWHSHPPTKVLILPTDNIFFTPPSDADIYMALLNSFLDHNNVSVVFAIEGIYFVVISESAKNKITSEFAKNGFQKNSADLASCPFVLQPIVEDTGFMGFYDDEDFRFLSNVVSSTVVEDIYNNADSFQHALDMYTGHYGKFGIEIIFQPPTNPLKHRENGV